MAAAHPLLPLMMNDDENSSFSSPASAASKTSRLNESLRDEVLRLRNH